MGTRSTNDAVILRLATAKEIAVEAERFLERRDDVGRMHFVLQMDLALETALKAVLAAGSAASGMPRRRRRDFPSLVQAVAKRVPSAVDILPLHDLRNAAQHEGQPPRENLRPHRDAALRALRDAFAALGADYDRFNLVHLVENPLLREPLDRALALAEARPGEAIAFAAHAFWRLRGMVEEIVGPAFGLPMAFFPSPRFADVQLTTKFADNQQNAVDRVLTAIAGVALGFDLHDHVRFRRLASGRRLRFTDGENGELRVDRKRLLVRQATGRDACWVIEYVSRHAVRQERSLPAIVRMIGPEHLARIHDPEHDRALGVLPRKEKDLGDE